MCISSKNKRDVKFSMVSMCVAYYFGEFSAFFKLFKNVSPIKQYFNKNKCNKFPISIFQLLFGSANS